jgi:hypothetical protein
MTARKGVAAGESPDEIIGLAAPPEEDAVFQGREGA